MMTPDLPIKLTDEKVLGLNGQDDPTEMLRLAVEKYQLGPKLQNINYHTRAISEITNFMPNFRH